MRTGRSTLGALQAPVQLAGRCACARSPADPPPLPLPSCPALLPSPPLQYDSNDDGFISPAEFQRLCNESPDIDLSGDEVAAAFDLLDAGEGRRCGCCLFGLLPARRARLQSGVACLLWGR